MTGLAAMPALTASAMLGADLSAAWLSASRMLLANAASMGSGMLWYLVPDAGMPLLNGDKTVSSCFSTSCTP